MVFNKKLVFVFALFLVKKIAGELRVAVLSLGQKTCVNQTASGNTELHFL